MFDEPVNGLDPEGVSGRTSSALAAEGRTVFVSSHLMSEMALTADHLIVIGRGKLIANAPIDELGPAGAAGKVVVRSPDSGHLAELLAPMAPTVIHEHDGALAVHGQPAPAIGATEQPPTDLVLHELTPERASLEDAYFELTGESVEYPRRTRTAHPRHRSHRIVTDTSLDTTDFPAPRSETRAELAPTAPHGGELPRRHRLRGDQAPLGSLDGVDAARHRRCDGWHRQALIALARVSRWDTIGTMRSSDSTRRASASAASTSRRSPIGVLGVLVISSEYSTGMIRTTLTAVPQRIRVLTAKVAVFAGVALAVALVACFAAFGIGQAIFASKDASVSLGDPGVLRAVVGGTRSTSPPSA